MGYALGAGGEAGVVRALELLEQEITTCLALLGLTGFDQLNTSHLHACQPTAAPTVRSAYPLIEE